METEVKNDPVVAIAGVTGAVGAEFIAIMEMRGFRVGKLKALASARSAGKTIAFRGERIVVEELSERSFEAVFGGRGPFREGRARLREGWGPRPTQSLPPPPGPERAACAP